MAAHASILAWRIPWTEEPGGLQSMVSQRVGTTESLFLKDCKIIIILLILLNNVGFLISKEGDLASAPGTRLDHLRAFV